MTLTQKEQPVGNSSKVRAEELTYDKLYVNTENPFVQTDYGLIVKAFEIECASWGEEDYALAYHYRDVYGTENFSHRVREQMNYYPGMHQTTNNVPPMDPQYTNAADMSEDRLNFWNSTMDNPDSFMNGVRQRQADFDYTTIFGSDASAEDRAREVGKMITECVPCFDRLLDPGALLPDADLLEIHGLNIQIRTDILDKIRSLFNDPGSYIDICQLLKLLSHLCPQDLLAILALLTQVLAKLNLDVQFNIDFIIQLVGPILSPFLDALSQWLDKWIQMILAPIICVVDHINEVILTAQTLEIPFSEVTGNVELDLGVAAPGHNNSSGTIGGGSGASTPGPEGEDGAAGAWGSWKWEQFNTPEAEKYNPSVPRVPSEEVQLAKEEIADSWGKDYSDLEREERLRRFEELKAQQQQKTRQVPPPMRRERNDGTRWSKDEIPNSEKYVQGGSWEAGYYPPEQQRRPAKAVTYFDASPLINSIVQLRNILQSGVQYVQDWFTYITQMIYDLLGTEVGWMATKADNTMLKSRIIQLIMMVKAILQAISKNGLECGVHSNFSEAQMKYILEEELNKNSKKSGSSTFRVNDDGTIEVLPPGQVIKPSVDNQTEPDQGIEGGTPSIDTGTTPDEQINVPTADEQNSVESGIIIRDCFKSIGHDDLVEMRKWIADFERSNG
jgi:hypothetical protein